MDDEIARLLGLIDDYVAHLSRFEGASSETVRAYTQHLEAYARWAARTGRDGLAPSTRDVRAYLSELRAAGYAARTVAAHLSSCLLYTSPSPRDGLLSRMPSSA